MHVVSVGGSIIIPKTGFDPSFLRRFRNMIIEKVKGGEKFILVIGGGATARAYQNAAKAVVSLSNTELDWLGIHTTVYNAQFVKCLFGDLAYKDIIQNPRKKIRTTKPIIVAAGEKPGSSTDYRAVLFAKTYGAQQVYNLSNIDYVYTKDPKKYKDAKKITHIGWQKFRDEIVGHDWNPGSNAPFDPIASKAAQKEGITVSILNGTKLSEVKKALSGKKFTGTIIS